LELNDTFGTRENSRCRKSLLQQLRYHLISHRLFIVAKVIKTTSKSTQVLTTERLLEQKGLQLMPERVNGWCWHNNMTPRELVLH